MLVPSQTRIALSAQRELMYQQQNILYIINIQYGLSQLEKEIGVKKLKLLTTYYINTGKIVTGQDIKNLDNKSQTQKM